MTIDGIKIQLFNEIIKANTDAAFEQIKSINDKCKRGILNEEFANELIQQTIGSITYNALNAAEKAIDETAKLSKDIANKRILKAIAESELTKIE